MKKNVYSAVQMLWSPKHYHGR